MTTKSIALTPEFRLTSDGDRNITLERRHIVDPTKAPGFERKNSESIAQTGAGLSVELREDWREDGCYGMTAAGLTAALSSAALKTAVEGEGCTTALSLTEFAANVAEEYRRLSDAVNGVFGGVGD